MRYTSQALSACLFLYAALATTPLAAQQPPLSWQTLDAVAAQVWEQGAGRAMQRAEAGLIAQRDRLPSRWQSLQLGAQLEAPLTGAATWDGAEHIFNALVTVQLGALPSKRAELLERTVLAQRAAQELERWRFTEEARLAYHAWWFHDAMATHLEADLAAKKAELEPLRRAADQQLLSTLDLLDLEAELGQVAAEVADAARQRDSAKAQLTALLGSGIELESQGAAQQAVDLDAIAQTNPWQACIDKLDKHPALRLLESQRQRALAEAEVWSRANPWQLEIGPQIRTIAFQDTWATASIALIAPLGNLYTSDVIAAQASAAQSASEATWEAARLRAGLHAQDTSWRAQREHLQRLEQDLLAPLRQRQALLEAAWQGRHVPLDRVLRGRRQLYEAEHTLIAARAELFLIHARASALAHHLSHD